MRLTLKNTTLDKYFGFLTKLDNVSKKHLIVKLTKSLEVKENPKLNLDNLYGAWEDSRDSDKIIEDIRSSRIEKSNINHL